MLNNRYLASDILALALAQAISSGAWAQGQPSGSGPQKWGAHVDLEAKPGSNRSLGEASLFVPFGQDERTLVFGDLRGRFDDHSNREGNIGIGVRRMLDGGWNLGTYGYYDRRRSESGNYFNQATFGAEVLGADWDFRANAYAPLGDRVRNLGSTITGGGAPTATLTGTTFTVTTPGATTISREERALKGYDIEAGWRVPVFDLTDHRQLRVFLGGYRFSDDTVKVSGPRARVEFALTNLSGLWRGGQLSFGAETQDDNVRGSQSFLSLRLRVPLGGSEARVQLSVQERRMTAPVVRDIDIVTQARATSTTVQPVVETATATFGGQNVTVISSATTTGANLPAAVAGAGASSTVLLSGTFNTSAITTLQSGQILMGASTLTVRSASGATAILVTPVATITGAVAGNNPAVAMANNSTLMGLSVSNVATGGGTPNPFAVRANGVTGATISNNTLLGIGDAGGGTAQALLITGGSSNIPLLATA